MRGKKLGVRENDWIEIVTDQLASNSRGSHSTAFSPSTNVDDEAGQLSGWLYSGWVLVLIDGCLDVLMVLWMDVFSGICLMVNCGPAILQTRYTLTWHVNVLCPLLSGL